PMKAITLPSSFFFSLTLLKLPAGGLTIFQPVRSLPLKSGIQPSSLSSAAPAGGTKANAAAKATTNPKIRNDCCMWKPRRIWRVCPVTECKGDATAGAATDQSRTGQRQVRIIGKNFAIRPLVLSTEFDRHNLVSAGEMRVWAIWCVCAVIALPVSTGHQGPQFFHP